MVESISTCWPPETGVTAAILSTLVPPAIVDVSVYVHVLPTVIGNGTELLDTTDVEPPELPEPVLADLELLLVLPLGVPEPPGEPEFPVLQPVTTRHAAAVSPTP